MAPRRPGGRVHAHFLGKVDGHNTYRAPCGHVVRNPTTRRCAACFEAHHRQQDKYVTRADPVAGPGRVRKEHRLIAERILGRRLKRTEIVHHINMDKRDNRPRNLLICSREYHKELHHRMELATAGRIHAWYDSQEV